MFSINISHCARSCLSYKKRAVVYCFLQLYRCPSRWLGPFFYWIVTLFWVPTETTPQACRDLQRAPQTRRVQNISKDSMPFLCSLVWHLYLQGLWLTDSDDNRDFSFSPSLTPFLCLSEEWVLNRRCRGSWREEWVGVGWSWIGAYLIGCQTSWSFSISTKWDEPPSPQTPTPKHTRMHTADILSN